MSGVSMTSAAVSEGDFTGFYILCVWRAPIYFLQVNKRIALWRVTPSKKATDAAFLAPGMFFVPRLAQFEALFDSQQESWVLVY
jgi:hypothetical protein